MPIVMQQKRTRLFLARSALGWRQHDLAARAKIHTPDFNRIERGVENPSQAVALRLGEALGLPAHFLFPDIFEE